MNQNQMIRVILLSTFLIVGTLWHINGNKETAWFFYIVALFNFAVAAFAEVGDN